MKMKKEVNMTVIGILNAAMWMLGLVITQIYTGFCYQGLHSGEPFSIQFRNVI